MNALYVIIGCMGLALAFEMFFVGLVYRRSHKCSREISYLKTCIQDLNSCIAEDRRKARNAVDYYGVFVKRIMEHGMAVFKLGDQVKFQGRAGIWTFSRKDDREVSPVVLTNGEWTEVFDEVLWQNNRIEVSEIAAAGWYVSSLEALR